MMAISSAGNIVAVIGRLRLWVYCTLDFPAMIT